MKAERLYKQLPPVIQNMACSYYGWRERRVRLGSRFTRYYRWLQETERAAQDDIQAYQDRQIAGLIRHAYDTVPYYRRVMDERGLKPADIVSRADLTKLPILQKEDIIACREEMISSAYPRRALRAGKTSGTTGTALSFYTTKDAVAFQWAVWWRHRWRFGVEPLALHLNFTGKLVVPPHQSAPPYWRWNWPLRQALVNMQHITPGKIQDLASFAGSRPFVYYSGYPSIIHQFSELLVQHGLQLRYVPRFVFLGAEGVQENQRFRIEEVTGACVTDQYGFAEGCGNASRCEHGPYHEDWEYGVLECVDPEPLPDGGMWGRIVATGFANYGFPFIRYEVGDTAMWEPQHYQCPCGRESKVIRRIEGRTEDYVVTPEGATIMRFDYIFKDTRNVKEAQVVQRELGSIVVRFVPREGFSSADEAAIRRKVKDWISPALRVHFEPVDRIPRGGSGKFRPVISELASKEDH